jgi:di/tricarboxylate transporter
LRRAGFEVFNFFAFTPIGLLILIAGVGYMVTLGSRLLGRAGDPAAAGPQRATVGDLIRAHELENRFFRVQVPETSPLAGQTIGEALLRTRYGVTVMGIERASGRHTGFVPGLRDSALRTGDVLLLSGAPGAIDSLARTEHGQLLPAGGASLGRAKREAGVAEVLIPPDSRLTGKTVREVAFRSRFGLTVLAIQRGQERFAGEINDIRLAFGDLLLLGGGWDQISALQQDSANLLVVRMPAELGEVAPARRKAPLALAIGLGMLALMTLNLVPSVTAVLIAALAMVVAGCVSMPDAYRAINWQSLVLIAGMIPMATALDKSGAMTLIVDGLMATIGGAGPMVLMAVLFLMTSLLSQVISNTATTVLVAPVAIGAAQGLEVAPYPLVMAVAIAASTAFATPVASPVNTLVLGPGNYRFIDFVKVGVPLQVLAMVVALLAIPFLFPF